MFTNKEYQYSNMFEFFFNSMIKRRYKTGGLDEKRLAEAEVRSLLFDCLKLPVSRLTFLLLRGGA